MRPSSIHSAAEEIAERVVLTEADDPSEELGDCLNQDTSNENVALQTFGYVKWVNDKVMTQYLPEAVDAEDALAERMGLIHMPLEERAGRGKIRQKNTSRPHSAELIKKGSFKGSLKRAKTTVGAAVGWRMIRSVLHAVDPSEMREREGAQTPSTRAETPAITENTEPVKEVKIEPVKIDPADMIAARLKYAVETGERDPEKLKQIKKDGEFKDRLSQLVRNAPRVSVAGPGKRATIALMPSSSGAVIPAGYENSCLSRGPFRSKIEFEKIDEKSRKGRWMIHLVSDNDEDITLESLGKGGPQMLITCHNEVHHGEYNPDNEPEDGEKDQLKQNVQMAAASKVKACPFCGIAEPVDAINLACGHSFCRAHLGDMLRTWKSSGIYTCPKCGEVEPQPDVLQLHSRQFDNKSAMTKDVFGSQDMSFGRSGPGPGRTRSPNEQMKVNKPRSQPQQGRPSARRRENGPKFNMKPPT